MPTEITEERGRPAHGEAELVRRALARLTACGQDARTPGRSTLRPAAAGLRRTGQDAVTPSENVQGEAGTASLLGGKARQLLELQRAGLLVPELRSWSGNIPEIVRDLGFPLAVRSSAQAEDGMDLSFAGQFKSFLNLRSLQEVRDAIDACLASAKAPSVDAYCQRHGIDPERLQMGVFIQRMVQPELAGVAFTVNPITGREEVVIEACAGLADQLLQGHQTALPSDHPLLVQHRAAIEDVARRAQQVLGIPLDIEFAVEDGRVYLLQARPITRIHFEADLGEWTNADFRDGGVSSSVCTPLMWSLYDYIWESTLQDFLRSIKLFRHEFCAGRMFFGRPYWNLGAVKECLAQLPGYVERDFDQDLGVQPRYEGQGRTTSVTFLGLLKALPTLWGVQRMWHRQDRFDRAFLEEEFSKRFEICAALPPNSATLRRLIQGLYYVTESNYFRTIFCASLAKLDFFEAFPEADYAALVSGLPDLAHLEPVEYIRQHGGARGIDRSDFLRLFGHRSRHELDIRAPRWDEDPEWVDRLLEDQTAPQARSSPGQTYEKALQLALSRLRPRQRARFQRKLERLRTFLWLREQMRDLSTRTYHLLRRAVLAVAQERSLGDDIFFMTWQEILDDDRSKIVSARAQYESFRDFRAPNEIGPRYPYQPGSSYSPSHDEQLAIGNWHSIRLAQDRSTILRGIAASPGKVRAKAHIARRVEEAIDAPNGCVLVCPFTDPGWTPVLSRVAAVITETGGLLSHAAVICREFGIPAVLSVSDATRKIKDGQDLVVDGGTGQVS